MPAIHITEHNPKKITVRYGNDKIVLYAGVQKENPTWFVKGVCRTNPITEARQRVSTARKTKEDALAYAEQMLTQHAPTDDKKPKFDADARFNAAKEALGAAGDDPDVLSFRERALRAASIVSEIRAKKADDGVFLRDAYTKFVEGKIERGASKRYAETLSNTLRKFDKVVGNKRLSKITIMDVENFMATTTNARTQSNFLRVLTTFGRWAQKREWLPYHIPTVFERVDKPKVKRKEHAIYTPDQLEKVLRTAENNPKFREFIPWLVIGAFCGVRAAERDRLFWEDVDLINRVIVMSTEITKTGRRRVVPIPENAAAWLRIYRNRPLQYEDAYYVSFVSWYENLRELHKLAGVPVIPNGLRASCASYMLMRSENAYATSLAMGHSVNELETTYFAPALKEQAHKWFGIMPTADEREESKNAEQDGRRQKEGRLQRIRRHIVRSPSLGRKEALLALRRYEDGNPRIRREARSGSQAAA